MQPKPQPAADLGGLEVAQDMKIFQTAASLAGVQYGQLRPS